MPLREKILFELLIVDRNQITRVNRFSLLFSFVLALFYIILTPATSPLFLEHGIWNPNFMKTK